MRSLFLLPILLLAGCVTDQQRTDIANVQQAMHGAAESLPPSPQRAVILAGTEATAAAVGHPIPTTLGATP
jgi:hypothetical protein